MAFPNLARSGLAAHRVGRLYLFWAGEPNTWIDVTATLERKIAALAAHASQIREPESLAADISKWAGERGKAIGVAAAETMRLVVIDDDEEDADKTAD
jgi:LmbE family N-acetylglucosaminyl deacetylase